jgi:hypothetical protein
MNQTATNQEFYDLLSQCRALRPEVEYISVESYYGCYHQRAKFWAHSKAKAWVGDTPEDLLSDIAERAA